MKKVICSILLAFICLFMLAPTSYAASHVNTDKQTSVQPLASGGGCANSRKTDNITIRSCISYASSTVYGDAYVTIPSSTASHPTCSVVVYIMTTSSEVANFNAYPCRSGDNYYRKVGLSTWSASYRTATTVTYYAKTLSQSSPILNV